MSSKSYSARRNAINWTLGKLNSPLHKWKAQHFVWLSEDKILQDTYTWEKADTPLKTARYILAREDRWFETGIKEAIHVKLKKPSLNWGGGQRQFAITHI